MPCYNNVPTWAICNNECAVIYIAIPCDGSNHGVLYFPQVRNLTIPPVGDWYSRLLTLYSPHEHLYSPRHSKSSEKACECVLMCKTITTCCATQPTNNNQPTKLKRPNQPQGIILNPFIRIIMNDALCLTIQDLTSATCMCGIIIKWPM